MTKTYNWEALKKKYILSDYASINAFLEEQGMNRNWYSSQKTKGWAKYKLELEMEAKAKARENTVNSLAKLFTPSEKEISQTYEAVFTTLRLKAISNYQKIKRMPDWTIIIPPDVNMNESKIIWEIIKAERWEPTRFTDKWDFIPEGEDDQDDITFFLPNNWRDDLKQLN